MVKSFLVLTILALTSLSGPRAGAVACATFLSTANPLWDSIPDVAAFEASGVRFEFTDTPNGRVDLSFNDGNGREIKGHVERPILRKPLSPLILMFKSARLIQAEGRIPAFVRLAHAPDLVQGRGWPTIVLASLYALKMQGLAYGELNRAEVRLTNEEVVRQVSEMLSLGDGRSLLGREQPLSVWQPLVQNTSAYKYLSAVLELSGHKILKETVHPLARPGLMSHQAIPDFFHTALPEPGERSVPHFYIQWELGPAAAQ